MPIASVIVPCCNERDSIEATLHSILTQEEISGGFEVIVADGMSEDGTRELLERLAAADPRLKIVENPGRIVSTGLNAAIRVSRGDIIVRMDAHCTYAKDYLRQCCETLRETQADNVGGPWVAEGKGPMGRAIAAAFNSPFASGGGRAHDRNYEGIVDTVYLGCWPRNVFDRFQLFDEGLVRNQDDEFNLRITRAGGKIWQSPRIKSWYSTRLSLSALFKQYMQYGYWKVRVIQKHKLPASVRHLVPATFVLSLIVLTPALLLSPLGAKVWLSLVTAYALCNLIASLLTAAGNGWSIVFQLPAVFVCYHLSYGYGFLRGFFDFVILRRQASRSFTELSRPSFEAHNQLLSKNSTLG